LIRHQEEDIDFQFLTASKKLSGQNLDDFYQYEKSRKRLNEEFGSYRDLDSIRDKIVELNKIIQSLKENSRSVFSETQVHKVDRFIRNFRELIDRFQWSKKFSLSDLRRASITLRDGRSVISVIEMLSGLLEKLEEIESDLSQSLDDLMQKIDNLDRTKAKLEQNGYVYITILSNSRLLFCQTSSDPRIFDVIAEKVYFACPLTQVFLFLADTGRVNLLDISEGLLSYIESTDTAKKEIGNWYTYEFAPVKILAEIFQRCRDEDTEVALVSGGDYGNSLMLIQKEVNQFFHDKVVAIENKFKKITFKIKNSGQILLPEDLSHGELKKFGIYIWLKYTEIKDAIVLMDEVETNFHPDWQYSIVHELLEWSDNNQFILATHSYELCSAVTPAHVNEIEPRLNSKKQDSQDNQ